MLALLLLLSAFSVSATAGSEDPALSPNCLEEVLANVCEHTVACAEIAPTDARVIALHATSLESVMELLCSGVLRNGYMENGISAFPTRERVGESTYAATAFAQLESRPDYATVYGILHAAMEELQLPHEPVTMAALMGFYKSWQANTPPREEDLEELNISEETLRAAFEKYRSRKGFIIGIGETASGLAHPFRYPGMAKEEPAVELHLTPDLPAGLSFEHIVSIHPRGELEGALIRRLKALPSETGKK
jgi:hypothetical protein